MTNINDRLTKATEARRAATVGDAENAQNVSDPMTKGVTAGWLAQAFGIDVKTVRQRLQHCPVKSVRQRGTKMTTTLYELKVAAAYLVTPVFSTKDYMRSLKRGELPPNLQQTMWDSLLKQQTWEERAGQLWRTEKVREVLGGTFQTIKFTVQLWADTVERQAELSEQQREIILQLVEGLQQEVYDSMVTQAAQQQTPSTLAELPKHTRGETEPIAAILADVDTDDDAWDYEIEDMV